MTDSPSPITEPAWETLAPGLEVLLRPDTSNDIVALVVFRTLGSAIELQSDAGIVSLTQRMLQRGTRRLNQAELAETIDSLGISLSCSAADDYSNIHVITTSDTLSESIALLSEIFFEPAFEPEEIEKERQSTLAAIRRSEDDLLSFTLKQFFLQLYPDHGYGLPGAGLPESVGELTRAQIINTHEELTAGPFKLIAVGNFEAAHLRQLLQDKFATRMRPDTNESLIPAQPVAAPPVVTTLTRKSEQAYFVAGFPALPPTHPLYFAARVLNAVLGEGMSSRLFSTLREDKGLAYVTGSSYSTQKLAAQLFGYIGTKPESLETAQTGMIQEFDRIKAELVPDEELTRARNYLAGKFLIDHQTNFRRAFYPGHFEMMGLGWQMDDHYASHILAVTPDQVRQAANLILNDATIVQLVPKN